MITLSNGFAQTHLNGTGCPDLGDILLFPFSGDIKDNTYKSEYDKSTQKASPGYYAVTLSDYGVDAEITATAHTALHRYKYNNEGPARRWSTFNAVWSEARMH